MQITLAHALLAGLLEQTPPRELAVLLEFLMAGRGINLDLRNE